LRCDHRDSFHTQPPNLTGHVALVPGGTGAVGEGVVRRLLAAGADVVVPTRSPARESEFRQVLGSAAGGRLHLFIDDYTDFDGARALVAATVDLRGSLDHVVAPIGGWWAGKRLDQIDTADWESAFVGLATAHMAMLRAALPVMSERGSYAVIVGDSAEYPVPGSGLVSMEQAAVLMMQRVAAAEQGRRVFALQLGPVRTRVVEGEPGWISAEEVGTVAVALAANASVSGRTIPLHGTDEMVSALEALA
jgi:NAD(P)-dependent dehydrogenase (short-subunit alcohol dehydrogenase family)